MDRQVFVSWLMFVAGTAGLSFGAPLVAMFAQENRVYRRVVVAFIVSAALFAASFWVGAPR